MSCIKVVVLAALPRSPSVLPLGKKKTRCVLATQVLVAKINFSRQLNYHKMNRLTVSTTLHRLDSVCSCGRIGLTYIHHCKKENGERGEKGRRRPSTF